MEEQDLTINIYQDNDMKNISYQTRLPKGLLPYFRTWNSIIEASQEMRGTESNHPLLAPKNCTGSEEYFKKMLEFAEFVKGENFPKDRKISLDPSASYDQSDFVPTDFEVEFFNQVRKLPIDNDVIRHMLTPEQFANYKPSPQDPVLCLYFAANYHAFLELLEACAKNTAVQMQNLSVEELEQMLHEDNPEASEAPTTS